MNTVSGCGYCNGYTDEPCVCGPTVSCYDKPCRWSIPKPRKRTPPPQDAIPDVAEGVGDHDW